MMKTNKYIFKLTIGIFLIASVTAYAINSDPIKKTAKSDVINNEYSWDLNDEYVKLAYQDEPQEEAQFLSEIIAKWDAMKAPKFIGRSKAFTAIFKSNKGLEEVTYDRNGLVLATEKRLDHVVLPSQLTQLMWKRYEGWIIVDNEYHVTYKQGDEVERTYHLTLEKGKERKMIRVNV